MRATILPNWYYGLLPADVWPRPPRDFYGYALNFLNFGPAGGVGTVIRKTAVFSRRVEALVFGGTALVTLTTDDVIFEPATGTWDQCLIQLSNPAGNELYTGVPGSGGEVPLNTVLATADGGVGGGLSSGKSQPGGFAGLWPVPIRVGRGGAITVQLRSLNQFSNMNARIMLWVALVATPVRKAA